MIYIYIYIYQCILVRLVLVFSFEGAKVNAARLHDTPLHHAAKTMQVEMVETLVEFGANVYARDQHNKRPVEYTTPGSPSATCLTFYESRLCHKVRASRNTNTVYKVGLIELCNCTTA